MKKIFTLALAAMAAMTMFATTASVTVWEGLITNPEWSEKHDAEAAVLNLIDADMLKAGDMLKVYGYRTDGFAEGEYCKIAVINGSWTSLIDGSTGDDRTCLAFNDSAKWAAEALQSESFEVTEETLPLFSGFIFSGHGFSITKVEASVYRVSKKEEVTDLETSIALWVAEEDWMEQEEPSNMIDGWGEYTVSLTDPEFVALFAATYTRVANLYVKLVDIDGDPLVDEGQAFRISGNWADWAESALPKDGYNHIMNMDEDGVVKVVLNEDFIDKTINSEDAGFVLWGAGYFFVEAVGTTKEAVMNATPTALRNVEMTKDGIRYNIMGQKVSEDYKGIVILNGKKMLQ